MSTQRLTAALMWSWMIVAWALPCWGAPPQQATPPPGEKAGNISALLPVTAIARGTGKQQVSAPAKKGDELYWNDVVRTDKGGRARITLLDQSILSLGSQSELRIVKHDAKTQQTSLELGYGRMRAEVTTVTKSGGKFEVKTSTAVAGVIGTVFGSESSIGMTTFLCLAGTVTVGNVDPNVPGQVACQPGMAAVVNAGKAPVTRPATQQEIQKLIQETEPAVISSLSPATTLPGATLDAAMAGSRLSGISSVGVSGGTGVTASMNPGGTDSSAGVHIVVAANAAPGPRTLTFTKRSGASSAAVFTVLAPPGVGTQAGAPSPQDYLNIFDQERQAAIASLNGMGLGLAQSANQAGQQINAANSRLNPPLDISQAANDLQGPINTEMSAAVAAGTAVNQAAQAASTDFSQRFSQALAALQGRNPSGTPDNTFLDAVTTAFNQVNTTMLAAFGQAQNGLGQTVQAQNAAIEQVTQTWLSRIAQAQQAQQGGPVPKVNSLQLSVNTGDVGTFDATGSSGTGGASIASYSWVLCAPPFRAPQYGVPLPPAQAPQCTAVPGYTAAGATFAPSTCGLASGDYTARLTVTDSNNNSAVMFTTLTVIAPSYDDPTTRLRNLAAAYMSLQSDQFLRFFDTSSFAGYSQLSENIRRTMLGLGSMNINLRISQANVACTQATLRADWQQNYTFKGSCTSLTACQPPVFSQQEQLTVRMDLTPGRGWWIVDLQGDNGTVQGTPTGPVVSDTSGTVDLVVSALLYAGPARNFSTQPWLNGEPLPFSVTVANIGTTSSLSGETVALTLNGTVVGQATLSSPLAPGGSVKLSFNVTAPNVELPSSSTLTATVTPATGETDSNAANNSGNLILPTSTPTPPPPQPDLAMKGLAYTGPARNFSTQPWQAGETLSFTATVANMGTANTAGGETITLALNGTQVGQATLSVLAPGNSVTVPFNIAATNPVLTGTSTLMATVAPAAGETDSNPGNNSFSLSIQTETVQPLPDLAVTTLSYAGPARNFGTQPWLGGETLSFSVTVANLGTANSAGGEAVALTLNGVFLGQATVASPLSPTQSTVLNFQVTAPSPIVGAVNGVSTLTATLTPAASETDSNPTNNSKSVSIQTQGQAPPDLAVSAPACTGAGCRNFASLPWLSGEAQSFTVTVSNAGSGSSAGGERVTLTLNGVVVGQTTAASLAAGASTTLTFPVVASDPVSTGSSTLTATVAADLGETNTANNSASLSIQTSDWGLSVSGAGSSTATPVTLAAGGAVVNATVQAAASSGGFNGPVNLVPGLFSSHIIEGTPSPNVLGGGTLSASVAVSADASAPIGQYFAQVIAQMKDGAAVTAQRQATIQIAVGTGTPAVGVTITSSAGNTSSGAPFQLNGVLAGGLSLTASRNDGQTAGSVDLVMSDSPPIVSSPPAMKQVPWATPEFFEFAAAINPDGSISPVATTVIVSATAIQLAARTSPSPVGTQQTTLFFNIGDINVNAPATVALPPGCSNVSAQVSFVPVNGFNASSLSWQWSSLASGLSVDIPSGTDVFSSGAYSPGTHTFSFSNSNASAGGIASSFFLVTISGPLGVATKSFGVNFDLSPAACPAAANLTGGRAANLVKTTGGVFLQGTWKKGGPSGGMARSRPPVISLSALPDVQLASSDISFTPSLPAAGDTLLVRFRLTNAGDVDAVGVPVALQINGTTVASDTFDMARGKSTLAGLQWVVSAVPGAKANPLGMSTANAMLVVDPAHSSHQKSTVGKSARLAHFALRAGTSGSTSAEFGGGLQRAVLQLREDSCVGLRFSSGTSSSCSGADVEVTAGNLAGGSFLLEAQNGITDLGVGSPGANLKAARYSSQARAVAGHSYAVQLSGGKVGILTVQSIRNPQQLKAGSRQKFGRKAVPMGEGSAPPDVGDTAGTGGAEATALISVTYGVQ